MKTILIADSDAPVRLDAADYRILEAVDGTAALEIATETPVDLLVTDPCIAGLDDLLRLQGLLSRRARKVLAVSGCLCAEDRFRADVALKKPFDPDELIRCARALIEPGIRPA